MAKPSETTLRVISGLPGLELVRAEGSRRAVAPHVHGGYSFGAITAGSRLTGPPNAPVTAEAGSIVLVNPGAVHLSAPAGEDGQGYRMYCASQDLIRAVLARAGHRGRPLPRFTVDVVPPQEDRAEATEAGPDEPVGIQAELFGEMVELHRDLDGPMGALESQTRFTELAVRLFTAYGGLDSDSWPGKGAEPGASSASAPGRDGQAVAAARRAEGYLRAHLAEDVDLDDLSRAACLSPFHLCRAFKKAYGLPPHAYLTQLRLVRSRELLRAGASLGQAALECGFFDQSHFTNAFAKFTGLTPGEFARAAGKGKSGE